MPNRIIRDWTDSEPMNNISLQAEVLFVRLIMKADDYGCFHANPKLIKGALFPLRDVRESDITRWMDEIRKAGLIAFYAEAGKTYLLIKNFGQRLRSMKRRHPEPNDSNLLTIDGDSRTIDRNPRPETETEVETKPKQETEGEVARPALILPHSGEEFKEKWEKLLKQKKWRGKSLDALQESLQILSEAPEQDAIKMMQKSIAGNWQGVFPLDERDKTKKPGATRSFPNHYDADFMRKLPTDQWQLYWEHLRNQGLKPVKNKIGEVIDWRKTA